MLNITPAPYRIPEAESRVSPLAQQVMRYTVTDAPPSRTWRWRALGSLDFCQLVVTLWGGARLHLPLVIVSATRLLGKNQGHATRAMSGAMPLVRMLVHPWCGASVVINTAIFFHYQKTTHQKHWCTGGAVKTGV